MCVNILVDILLDLRVLRSHLIGECPYISFNRSISILRSLNSCYGFLYNGIFHSIKLRLRRKCHGACLGQCLCLNFLTILHESKCYLSSLRPCSHIGSVSILPCLLSLKLHCLGLYCYSISIKIEVSVVLGLHRQICSIRHTIMNSLNKNCSVIIDICPAVAVCSCLRIRLTLCFLCYLSSYNLTTCF